MWQNAGERINEKLIKAWEGPLINNVRGELTPNQHDNHTVTYNKQAQRTTKGQTNTPQEITLTKQNTAVTSTTQ